MLSSRKMRITGLLLLTLGFLYTSPSIVEAQNEVQLQQAALQGINGFYVSVNVEGSEDIMRFDTLNVERLQRKAENKLDEAGLPLKQELAGDKRQNAPMLHVHLNVMHAGQGLIPFSVEVNFYQPVKLVLNRDIQTSASTWNSGYLGMVSYDRTSLIRESLLKELDNFVREFQAAN